VFDNFNQGLARVTWYVYLTWSVNWYKRKR